MAKPKLKDYTDVLFRRESELNICSIPHDLKGNEGEMMRGKLLDYTEWWMQQLDFAKWPRSMGWFQNHSFIAGNHYPAYHWNGSSMVFDPSGALPDTAHSSPRLSARPANSLIPRTSDDHLIRPYEQNISLMTEQRPVPRVLPNSALAEDQESAELAQIVHQLYWEEPLGMPDKLRGLGGVLCTQGLGAIEISMEDTDQIVTVPAYEEVDEIDAFTLEAYKARQMTGEVTQKFRRDMRAKMFNSFQLQPNPSATDDQDTLQWICRTTFEDVGWIQNALNIDAEGYYPENLERIDEQSSGFNTPLYWWERVKDLIDTPETWYGLTARPYTTANGATPGQTTFRVFDCKPNKLHPEGRTIITAGGALLYCGPARAYSAEFPWRWHPYAIFRFWRNTGRFWATPLLSKLVPLQKRINMIDALIAINRQYMTLGQWLVPRQSKVPKGYMSGHPGREIPYNASSTGAKPERVSHEPLPAELVRERDDMEKSIDVISGSGSILPENMGSGLRANSMLEFLKRQAYAGKVTFFQGLEQGLEIVSQNILIEVSLGIEDESPELTRRIQAAAREMSPMAVQSFVGADLRQNVRLKLDIASALLKSPEAEEEKLMLFYQHRAPNLTPEEFAIFAIKMGWSEFDRTNTPQYKRASKMISRIVQGNVEMAMPIPEMDDPKVFMDVIRNAVLSDRSLYYGEEVLKTLFRLYDFYAQLMNHQEQQQFMKQVYLAGQMARAQHGVFPGEPTSPEKQGGTGDQPLELDSGMGKAA